MWNRIDKRNFFKKYFGKTKKSKKQKNKCGKEGKSEETKGDYERANQSVRGRKKKRENPTYLSRWRTFLPILLAAAATIDSVKPTKLTSPYQYWKWETDNINKAYIGKNQYPSQRRRHRIHLADSLPWFPAVNCNRMKNSEHKLDFLLDARNWLRNQFISMKFRELHWVKGHSRRFAFAPYFHCFTIVSELQLDRTGRCESWTERWFVGA